MSAVSHVDVRLVFIWKGETENQSSVHIMAVPDSTKSLDAGLIGP